MNREEAIKIVKSHYPANKQMLNEALEFLIPELKESEDEKIRKDLITFLDEICYFGKNANFDKWNKSDCSNWINWIEKQGDKDKLIQELGEYKVKYTQEVLEQYINSMGNKDERLRKTTIAFLKDFAEQGYENAVECIDWLEKQDEKKIAWSEEDEEIVEALNDYTKNLDIFFSEIKIGDKDILSKEFREKVQHWLKTLKGRVQPQSKQEWSEEDENGLGDALWAIKQARTIAKNENEMGGLWYAERWLKSLKDRIQSRQNEEPQGKSATENKAKQ